MPNNKKYSVIITTSMKREFLLEANTERKARELALKEVNNNWRESEYVYQSVEHDEYPHVTELDDSVDITDPKSLTEVL